MDTPTNGAIILVRPEQAPMYQAIYSVHEQAFGRANEAIVVEKLRQTENFNPRLSLVALRDGSVVGHVLFYPVTIEMPDGSTAQATGLGPIGVLPEHQTIGIGEALVWQGFEFCRKEKAYALVVLGNPKYYTRFGFKTSTEFGLKCSYDVPEDVFMACELKAGAWDGMTGVVKYHPAFDEAE